MNKVFLILLTVMAMTSLVFAAGQQLGVQASINSGDDSENGLSVQASLELGEQNQVRNRIEAGEYMNEAGEKMKIESKEGNGINLRVRNVTMHSDMNITEEMVQNRTMLRVKLSNGLNSEVKVMPDKASETALARLGAKCEENNCSIELKEVGTGNQTRAAYEIKTQKESKVLGLFKAQMKVQAQVDAESGEIIQTRKPWWAFLATE